MALAETSVEDPSRVLEQTFLLNAYDPPSQTVLGSGHNQCICRLQGFLETE